jgi:2-polyprenyl-3-methyl-5-hydroxy-6-metoxy-1,4-benzoquinol methylase
MPSPRPHSDSDHSDNSRSIASSFEHPDWYLNGYATNIRIRVETVLTLLDGHKTERILDVGCGDGSLSLPLLSRAKHITYLDQSHAMLEKVKARITGSSGPEIRYIPAAFMEADLPHAYFDLIVCVGVLAYVDDIDAFLARLSALLSQDGLLILECTDATHFLSRADKTYQRATAILKPKRFKTYQHSSAGVIRVANNKGLLLLQTFRYAYSFPLFSRFLSAPFLYKIIRRCFGNVSSNKRRSLGNQWILFLTRKSNI